MPDDPTTLAWEMLAKLTATIGRLPPDPIDDAHQRLVDWIRASDINAEIARNWLASLDDQPPSGRPDPEEHRLRAQIERALGLRDGPKGIIGLVRRRRSAR